MKKICLFLFLLFINSIILSNEIEKNKVLNVMVDHNYDLNDQKYNDLGTYFCFPFTFNGENKTRIAENERELKKIFKKIRKGLPKDHSHKDWKKMNVKILNDKIAIVNAMYSSINDEDDNYFTGTAMYLFRKIDNSWKIFSITPFKPYNYFLFE